MVHDRNGLREDLSPVFETGRPGGKDVTPSQQGGENVLKHSDGPFGRVGFALLGFEPDHFAESRHEGAELTHIFITQGRLSVRVEDLDPFKAGAFSMSRRTGLRLCQDLSLTARTNTKELSRLTPKRKVSERRALTLRALPLEHCHCERFASAAFATVRHRHPPPSATAIRHLLLPSAAVRHRPPPST